jgi:lysyl-tRNA synthetase class II
MGIGIDILTMLMAKQQSDQDVLFHQQMKPEARRQIDSIH